MCCCLVESINEYHAALKTYNKEQQNIEMIRQALSPAQYLKKEHESTSWKVIKTFPMSYLTSAPLTVKYNLPLHHSSYCLLPVAGCHIKLAHNWLAIPSAHSSISLSIPSVLVQAKCSSWPNMMFKLITSVSRYDYHRVLLHRVLIHSHLGAH